MPFVSELEVQETPDNRWQLLADLHYEGRDELFTVPAGYVTDFASVPQIFLWLIPRSGRYTKAAVLHDYLTEQADAGQLSVCDADGIFRRTMRELGVSVVRRWLMWTAVRWRRPSRIRECGLLSTLLSFALSATFIVPAVLVGIPTFALLFVFYVFELAVHRALRLLGRPSEPPLFIWWAQPSHRGLDLPG